MTAILGISAYYHDSAAALVVDGKIVAAAQEERFTRIKHDAAFPIHAVEYSLKAAGISAADIDYVAFYDKPLLKFLRLLETHVACAPRGFTSFATAMPSWLKEKLFLGRSLRRALGGQYRKRLVYLEHHESHAASAFFPSPFERAAILTVDGVGEWTTVSLGLGEKNHVRILHEMRFPHSMGMLYSAFTYFCGFKVNSAEYKLMGLAPFGQPVYVEQIKQHLLDIKPDGSFWMNMDYFNYCQGLTMTNSRFAELFGGPPRVPEGPLTQREMDLAASIQQVTEEILETMVAFIHRETGVDHLCLAGGVALNCVANARISNRGPFQGLWIQPAAGDAGGALGAALFVWYQLLDQTREVQQPDAQQGSLLGPEFTNEEIESFLQSVQADFQRFESEQELCELTARLISEGNVVGWFQGRMEFGPRALGNRSILGDPRNLGMQSTMNSTIKRRESFRPFAPSVLREHAHEYFENMVSVESPYMMLVEPVNMNHRILPQEGAPPLQGLDMLRVTRSDIPAVTHVDYTARVQTVDPVRNPRYHRLLQSFFEITGCPVLVNTSFNVRGEPIVCRPEEAYRCFMANDIDVLVLNDYILLRKDQKPLAEQDRQAYMSSVEMD